MNVKVRTRCELKKSLPDESWVSSQSGDGGDSSVASSIASIANSSGGSGIANWGNSSLEGQVISTGSSHSGLINWDNSAIGEGLESIEALGGSGGNTSGENLEIRDFLDSCEFTSFM